MRHLGTRSPGKNNNSRHMLRGAMLPEHHEFWQQAYLETRCCWYVALTFPLQERERVYADGAMALGKNGKINRTGDWKSSLQEPTAETQPQEQMSRALRTSEELRIRLSPGATGRSTARCILKGTQLWAMAEKPSQTWDPGGAMMS